MAKGPLSPEVHGLAVDKGRSGPVSNRRPIRIACRIRGLGPDWHQELRETAPRNRPRYAIRSNDADRPGTTLGLTGPYRLATEAESGFTVTTVSS